MKNLENIKKVADDIQTITIQGATNIAREACKIMASEFRGAQFNSDEEMQNFFTEASNLLIGARETEPLLRNAMKYAKSKLKSGATADEIADSFVEYLSWIEREEKIRPQVGADLIHDGDLIFTHCHSKSVIDTLIQARNDGKKINVYNTETRPLYQGRKTSKDLLEAGIPDTMVTDDSAPYFIDNTTEKDIDIKKVFLGSDCIKPDGATINKVGSFSIGLSAWHSGIPLYIVGSLLKVDIEKTIGIEQRNGKELWPEAPDGLNILNYAFDMVSPKCITGIITEFGVIRPENLMKEIQIHYPRMIEIY